MAHATHANAALIPRARLRLARLIIDGGWDVSGAAERYDVSWKTANKWAVPYATTPRDTEQCDYHFPEGSPAAADFGYVVDRALPRP